VGNSDGRNPRVRPRNPGGGPLSRSSVAFGIGRTFLVPSEASWDQCRRRGAKGKCPAAPEPEDWGAAEAPTGMSGEPDLAGRKRPEDHPLSAASRLALDVVRLDHSALVELRLDRPIDRLVRGAVMLRRWSVCAQASLPLLGVGLVRPGSRAEGTLARLLGGGLPAAVARGRRCAARSTINYGDSDRCAAEGASRPVRGADPRGDQAR
jgi:hypothetical protein